jgi:hypothetical protein
MGATVVASRARRHGHYQCRQLCTAGEVVCAPRRSSGRLNSYVRAPAVTGGRTGGPWGARTPDDRVRTAGPWRACTVGSVFRAFPRFEASGGGRRPWEGATCLGNMRRRLGLRGSGGQRRGARAAHRLARHHGAALLWLCTF